MLKKGGTPWLGRVFSSLLGLDDIENCFGHGSVEGCGLTAANFIPGVDEIKAAAKVLKGVHDAEEAAKAAKTAKALEDAGKCLRNNSFAPDTKVLTADGKSKPIKDLKVGDDVRTGSPTTGKSAGAHKITATMIHNDDNLVDIVITTANGHHTTLHTTTEHPFWDDTTHAWVQAASLTPGHKLITAANGTVVLAAVYRLPSPAKDMYNLTVQDLHTYYVLAGATPVLVHNSSCPIGFTADTVSDAFTGMNKGGGHAMRYLIKDGLIPNKGSVASQAEYFEKNFSQVLTSPQKTFDWKIGGTQARGFSRRVDGRVVVLFVAKEGPYQGKVLSSVVPNARNMTKWGL